MNQKKHVTLRELQASAKRAERGASELKDLLQGFSDITSYNNDETRRILRVYEPTVRKKFATMLQRIIDFRCILSDFLDDKEDQTKQ